MDEEFDAIIIGAGPAGSIAAYKLAKAGAMVLLVDRSPVIGCKNLSGAVLYGATLNKVIPEFWNEAPIERAITKNHVMMMSGDDCFHMVYDHPGFAEAPYNGFSVERGKFDQWLADKAEAEGAMVAPGIKVDKLIIEDGKVVGIDAAGEEMRAKIVIDAEGVNNFLAQQAGLAKPLNPHEVAVGIKETIALSEQTINDRFGVESGFGEAFAIMGEATKGLPGGGFFYTNKDSVSIGLVVHVAELDESGLGITDLLEAYLAHPAIAPYLRGGETIEYGAHLVCEGGIGAMPKLSSDGIILAGDAAGLGVNSGLVVRGIDLAIASGSIAADAVLAAKEKDAYDATTLRACYDDVLMKSASLVDMGTYAKAGHFMKNKHLYTSAPALVNDIFKGVYVQDDTPKQHIMATAKSCLKQSDMKMGDLIKMGLEGVKAL